MQAIQSVGVGHSSQVTTDISQVAMSMTSHMSGSNSVKNINSAVSGMLKSIGGGLGNNELLKAIIALIIIAALLQESVNGGGQGAAESLRALGSGRGGPVLGMGMTSSLASFESTSVAYHSTTITPADAGTTNGTDLGGRMDITG